VVRNGRTGFRRGRVASAAGALHSEPGLADPLVVLVRPAQTCSRMALFEDRMVVLGEILGNLLTDRVGCRSAEAWPHRSGRRSRHADGTNRDGKRGAS